MMCPRCGRQAVYIQGVHWFCDVCDMTIDVVTKAKPRHNSNPPNETARAIRGVQATIAEIETDLSRLKTLLAELKTAATELFSDPTDPEAAELLADGFVYLGAPWWYKRETGKQ